MPEMVAKTVLSPAHPNSTLKLSIFLSRAQWGAVLWMRSQIHRERLEDRSNSTILAFSCGRPGVKIPSAVWEMCKPCWGWGPSGIGIPEVAEGSGKAENDSGNPGNLCNWLCILLNARQILSKPWSFWQDFCHQNWGKEIPKAPKLMESCSEGCLYLWYLVAVFRLKLIEMCVCSMRPGCLLLKGKHYSKKEM